MQVFGEWRGRLEKHWFVVLAVGLAIVIALVYLPIFSMGFVTDDFIEVGARHYDAVDSLPSENWGLWGAQFVKRALVDPVTDWEIFRPTRQWIFWADYFMWHLEPPGYHVTNLLLYWATCLSVSVLMWQLSRSRYAALLAGLLFALMPVHTSPVAEISSRGHILAGLLVCLCVIFYALPPRPLHTVVAWGMAILAIGSKETALVVPVLLLCYELVCRRDTLRSNPRGFLVRQAPFWIIAGAAAAFRLVFFGQLSSSPHVLGAWAPMYQMAGYVLYALYPFILDIDDAQTEWVLRVLVLLGVIYYKRKAVVFGLLWIPIMMATTLGFAPQERYLYTASIGLMLALGSILAQPFPRAARLGRIVGGAAAALLLITLGFSSYTRNTEHLSGGNIAASILQQVKTLHPTLPSKSQVYFSNLPLADRHGYIFTSPLQLKYAIQLLYDDRSLNATHVNEFPTTLANLDSTYFFEYEKRRINERTDLIQALRDRRGCAEAVDKKVAWVFTQDAQGWEPWNEIEQFEAREHALFLRTTGNDPFMGSPFLRVNPQDLERVEISMRARSDEPTLKAQLFWQTEKMGDFSAEASAGIEVLADGQSHTYALEPLVRGNAPVMRLRFDPADAPAEIELEAITLYCH